MVSQGNCREVKLLLAGKDPKVADYQGITALYYAAFYGYEKLVHALLEYMPGDLIGQMPIGETSLFIACQYGHLCVAKLLAKAGENSFICTTNINRASSRPSTRHLAFMSLARLDNWILSSFLSKQEAMSYFSSRERTTARACTWPILTYDFGQGRR
jgi:ankyrin repeat protein